MASVLMHVSFEDNSISAVFNDRAIFPRVLIQETLGLLRLSQMTSALLRAPPEDLCPFWLSSMTSVTHAPSEETDFYCGESPSEDVVDANGC